MRMLNNILRRQISVPISVSSAPLSVPFNSGNLKHFLDCRFEKYQLCNKKYRGRGRLDADKYAENTLKIIVQRSKIL